MRYIYKCKNCGVKYYGSEIEPPVIGNNVEKKAVFELAAIMTKMYFNQVDPHTQYDIHRCNRANTSQYGIAEIVGITY